MTRPWLLFATSCALSATVSAQEKCGPDDQVPWWPLGRYSTGGTTAAQRAAMEAALNGAQALVRKTVYGSPRGYAMWPGFGYGGEVGDRTRLHQYVFTFVPYWACNKYEENGSYITITFNPDPMAWSESDRPLPDEQGDGLYSERLRSDPLFGATGTFGHFDELNTEGVYILFTSNGESPTIPVTREEYLRAMIFTFEGKNQEKLKQSIAATMQMMANDPVERDKTLAGLRAPGDKLRGQIAAMTPKERAAPAWLYGYDLVEPGSRDAKAIVRRNSAFYRARTSPFEVRAILVHMPGAKPVLKTYHAQAYKEFDWEGLKKLLAP